MTDPLAASLSAIAAQFRAGTISAQALAEAAIDRHKRHGESLNSYKTWDPDNLIKQARAADAVRAAGVEAGPLHGLPVSVKDLFGVRGFPTYAGTPQPLPQKWTEEGPVITALRRQQALITGKTHTVEFAFGGLGVNPHWESPRNPWDAREHRVPGGSSSGAGISLWAGSAVLALGTDTAGSVRIPASMTGTVGLKTSIGRWPMAGIVPLSPSLDSVGLLARTVEDAAHAFFALDPVLASSNTRCTRLEEVELSTVRLGISDGLLWEECSPGVAEGVKAALDTLSARGARLVPLPLPEAEQVYPVFQKGGLAATELYVFLKNELPDWRQRLDRTIAQRMEEASTLPAWEYLERVALVDRLSARAVESLRTVDVVVCPTVAITPPTLEEVAFPENYRRANLLSLRNTSIVNYLGLCALTLPVALDRAGMPVGLQLIARHGEEERLLAVAGACEHCLGTGRERLGVPIQDTR
jgi:aspartyl-tRNA(Asn)/glutamyl-tRNA(Gln) amidotransferase subunit A